MEQLVGEFGKRQAVAGLAVETLLHRVLGHHVVDGDVLADFAGEVEECPAFHPVVVVDKLGCVGSIAVKVEKFRQLCLHPFDIVVEGIFGKEVALGRFARGVTNHAGGATDKGHRLVAAALEVAEYHHTAQVADMQRVGSGVKADVGCDLFFI